MWPFDDEEEPLDEQTAEFESVAREIYNQAPDSVTGLTALRDSFSAYEFPDKERASGIFSSYSDDVRKRFGETQAFDFETTMGLAPVDMIDITPSTEDPEEAKLDTINKWEEENLKFLSETDDTRYIQARSQLERGIKQAAAMQRRDYYGKDNYLVTDLGLRAGQGAIGPLADLLGADSVSDFFTEQTDPDRDDSYWSAIASGVGSAAGAIGSGVATTVTTGTPWGAAAYLGASGAGAVRKQVENSLENEGTAVEALEAGAIETVSQVAQVAAGGKVFGSVAKQIGGKVTAQLGARVFPRIAGNALLEGSAEAGGQVLSNIAENVGQDKDDDIFQGVTQSGVAGFVVGGAASGIGEIAAKRNGVTEISDLTNAIEETEGSGPPKLESIPAPRKSVELDTEAMPVANLSDKTQIVEADGQLHLQAGNKTLQGYDAVHYVSPETAELIRAVTNGNAPDGTAITLTTDDDGNLLLESEFLNDDLTVASTKTGGVRRKVPTAETPEGSVPVFVNKTRTTNGVRENGYFIAAGKVDSTNDGAIGAAKLGFGGQKESQYLQKLRKTYGEEDLLKRGLTAETEDGNISLYTYFPQTNVEQADVGTKFISERGILGTLDYLNGLERFNREDAGIASVLDFKLQEAMFAAEQAQDYKSLEQLTELHTAVLLNKSKIAGTTGGGGILQTYNETAQNKIAGRTVGDVQILKINQDLRRQATEELEKELGEEVSLPKFNKEVETADEIVAAIEKEIKDPVTIELANIDAEVERIGQEKVQKEINEPIQKFTKEIEELKAATETEKGNVKNQLSEADTLLKNEIDTTSQEITKIESEVKKASETPLTPTKAQVQKERTLNERLERLQDRKAKVQKQIDAKPPTDATEKQIHTFEKRVETAKSELEDIQKQISKTNTDKEALQSELNERRSQTRGPTSEQTKRLNALKSKLTTLNNQFANVKTQDPKKSNAVQRLRSLTAQRKRAIRDLKKQSKLPREMTPRQQQLLKKKEEIRIADKEGRIKTDPALTKKLVIAKNQQNAARAKLTKAEQKIQEKLSQFSPEDQKNLREWYNLLNDIPEGEAKRKVQNAIFNTESKYLPPNSSFKIDNLFNFWRRNILSGPITQVRNIVSNATNALSNVASTAVTGVPRGSVDFVAYAGGWVKGLIDGRTEMAEILSGNRPGRMTIGMNGEFAPTRLSLKNPLGAITEMMQRFMATADSAFYRGAESGQAYLVEYIAAEKQGIPLSERRAWVEDRLYNTKEKVEKITAEVENYAQTLQKAGIKMSPREKQLAVFERAQAMRDETTRAIAARHGEKSVFLQEPEGILGALARGLSSTAKDEEASTTIGNVKVYPLKHMFPFVRTIANVSNVFLDHSPLGFRGALKARKKAVQLRGEAVELSTGGTVSNALEARQIFGQAMIGSALMGGLFSVAMAFKDEEDPFIEFFGNVPRGKYKEWQEKGIIPYSMKIGSTYIGLQNTPLALVAAVIGGGMQGVKNGGNPALIASNAALASVGAVADLSFIKAAGDLFNMLTGSKTESFMEGSSKGQKTAENAIKNQVAGFASGFIPASGFLKNLGRWMESSPTEAYNNFAAKMFGQLPFSRDLGIGKPQLNVFGQPLNQDLWKRSGMSSFLSSKTTDPTLLWMQETGYTITDPGPILKLSDKEVEKYGALQETRTGYQDILDEVQSREVLEISGPQIQNFIEGIRRDPYYQAATKKNQDRINEQVSKFRAAAKLQVLTR